MIGRPSRRDWQIRRVTFRSRKSVGNVEPLSEPGDRENCCQFRGNFQTNAGENCLGNSEAISNPKHSFICTGFGVKRDGSAAL
jgi:hypothetical protein